MSVDIDWKTLTEGPDGVALAETIRDFIDERFQQIPFPKLIRSVKIHAFDFGTIAPSVVLKDICEPLAEFYETESEDSASAVSGEEATNPQRNTEQQPESTKTVKCAAKEIHQAHNNAPMRSDSIAFGHGTAPGVLGPTSNLGYFHLPLSAGLSGTATPLAAVAGAQFQHGPHSPLLQEQQQHQHHHSDSFSSSVSSITDAPPSKDDGFYEPQAASSAALEDDAGTETFVGDVPPDRSPEDLQVVFHATYAGDIKLSLTAEVFLDYPMPSFVGIPLKLNITGMTFDGVGILAYIKKRAHLCFLAQDDAHALVGDDHFETEGGGAENESTKSTKVGGLLEHIKIETEMGQTDNGKQVLKNVGKIEKFVLEQVQRIFEEEFVYPSFWTFLV
ncbi:mitochondrial distribution and morphology protein 12-like protein [Acrodontium crateriforme]|uniref:Mitochondrial distribution and morphology protein 12 n=1 Tax=Acrodontium crateriforme TaxID=150365 RepID=A0AAQ3MA91_9PEZI|nr:mitochondrial distribution and morphology protein 12-like protein [Acrodontium crateriforme]